MRNPWRPILSPRPSTLPFREVPIVSGDSYPESMSLLEGPFVRELSGEEAAAVVALALSGTLIMAIGGAR